MYARHLHTRSICFHLDKKRREKKIRIRRRQCARHIYDKSNHFIMEMIFIVDINVVERIYKWISYWIISSVDATTVRLVFEKNKNNPSILVSSSLFLIWGHKGLGEINECKSSVQTNSLIIDRNNFGQIENRNESRFRPLTFNGWLDGEPQTNESHGGKRSSNSIERLH